MNFHIYAPGTITVELRDQRRFVYTESQSAAEIVADLHAHGVDADQVLRTIHRVLGPPIGTLRGTWEGD